MRYALFFVCASVYGQPWSGFLDPSRAIDWRIPANSALGFTIPAYTAGCVGATGPGNTVPLGLPDAPMNIMSISDTFTAPNIHIFTIVVFGPLTAHAVAGEAVIVDGVTANAVYNRGFNLVSASGSTMTVQYNTTSNPGGFPAGGAVGTVLATQGVANTNSIQSALNSCDATHNVVNLASGSYYAAGVTYGGQGRQVLRGAGPNATTLIVSSAPCSGDFHGICMISSPAAVNTSSSVLPPGGARQCLWTAGYAVGTTAITLDSCPGGAPPVNQTLIIDQANDISDTGGVIMCDVSANAPAMMPGATGSTGGGCTAQGGTIGGRTIGGVTYGMQQLVTVTAVSGTGTGPFTVTISPGILLNNFRSSQSPGAWWPGTVANDGIENMTLDGSNIQGPIGGTLDMFNCFHCWVRNVRFLNGGRNSVVMRQSAQCVVRDSYFYGTQGTASTSYSVEFTISAGPLVENNIFQQQTTAVMFGIGNTEIIGYNYTVNSNYMGNFLQGSYYAHSGGNQMGLWEGNNMLAQWTDVVHGSSATATFFRNIVPGFQPLKTGYASPILVRAYHRGFNIVGNVLGQPGFHTTYEAYATSATAGVGTSGGSVRNIYEFGWVNYNAGVGSGPCGRADVAPGVYCDPLVRQSTMRWGNWDVVNNNTQWDATEASPGAFTFLNANFTPAYFSTLAHTLPNSLYYSSRPPWWPVSKPWPVVGPDITTGNLGLCSGGTYDGSQATAAGQCTGGTFAIAYAGHAYSTPAQDCYLNVMGGPPDGSGPALPFDAALCAGAVAAAGSGGAPIIGPIIGGQQSGKPPISVAPVQQATLVIAGTGPFNVTLPAVPVSGHTLLMCYNNRNQNSVPSVTQAGVAWSLVASTFSGTAPLINAWLFRGAVGPGASQSVTVSLSPQIQSGTLNTSEWANLSSTVDAPGVTLRGSSLTPSTAAYTTSAANTLVYACMGHGQIALPTAFPAGYQQLANVNNSAGGAAGIMTSPSVLVPAAAGAQSATWTIPASADWATILVALRDP